VIPDEAHLHVDCRVPPGMDEPEVRARLREVLPSDGYRLEFTEKIVAGSSPPDSPLMDALRGWTEQRDPGARLVPSIRPATPTRAPSAKRSSSAWHTDSSRSGT
jgi:acetylornithine deacetylase/succinyl-diaminopimelate desuccinylase-like protein